MTRAIRGRLPREEAEDRMNWFLDVALAEFSSRGYEGTTLDHLVQLTGVSKTTMIRRFGSKRGIFLTIVDTSSRGVREAYAHCLRDPGQPLESLTQFAETVAHFAFEPTNQAILRFGAGDDASDSEIRAVLLEAALVTFSPLTSYLADLMDAAVIQRDNPVDATFEFVAMANHGFRMLVDKPAFLDGPERSAKVAERFLKGRSI